MKLKHLLPAALLAIPALAMAIPAPSDLLTVTNPDGTTLKIRAFGDEHFCYYTDASCNYIMEPDARGYWNQAIRQGRALKVVDNDINLLYTEEAPSRLIFENIDNNSGKQRMAALTSEGRTEYDTEGEIPALVVLVEFSDIKFTVPNIQAQVEKFCNQEGYSDYRSSGSARDYFITASNGKFRPKFEVSRVVSVSHPELYYAENGHIKIGELIYEALTSLDNEIDFSRYDRDGDGLIDNIYFMYAGNGAADTGKKEILIWPHQGHYNNYVAYYGANVLVLDGVKMATYAIGNELKAADRIPTGAQAPWLDGIGTFVHEYGHVLGLPDLYNAEGSVETPAPGSYDVMDKGSYNNYSTQPPTYSAYEKWLCRWMEYTDVEDGNIYEVKAHSDGNNETAYRIRVPRAGTTTRFLDEYFIIEARDRNGWDTSFPENGMIIWHIDFNMSNWTSNTVNALGRARCMMVPSSTSGVKTYSWPNANTGATGSFPGNFPLTINAYNPNFHPYITNMTYDLEAKTGRFEYNMITESPKVATTAHTPTVYPGTRNLHISWDPVEDADAYFVTMKRIDDNGTERYVDLLNEKNVGNVTELKVLNISASAFNNHKFQYFVRVNQYVPSSEISNVVEFYPPQLAPFDESGVNAADAEDTLIFGSIGKIIAPANAQIYNMNGMLTGADNLAAGIYVVKHNGITRKVLVK